MKTDDLIVQLAGDLRPVQVMPRPAARWLRWSLGAGAIALAAIGLFGPRSQLAAALGSPVFASEALLLLAVTGLAGLAVMLSAVPGSRGVLVLWWAAVALAAGW